MELNGVQITEPATRFYCKGHDNELSQVARAFAITASVVQAAAMAQWCGTNTPYRPGSSGTLLSSDVFTFCHPATSAAASTAAVSHRKRTM